MGGIIRAGVTLNAYIRIGVTVDLLIRIGVTLDPVFSIGVALNIVISNRCDPLPSSFLSMSPSTKYFLIDGTHSFGVPIGFTTRWRIFEMVSFRAQVFVQVSLQHVHKRTVTVHTNTLSLCVQSQHYHSATLS